MASLDPTGSTAILQAVGDAVGHVHPLLLVVADAAAGLGQEAELADLAARHHDHVAGQGAPLRTAGDLDAADGLSALRAHRCKPGEMFDPGVGQALVAGALAGVGHGDHRHAGVGEIDRGIDAGVVRADHRGLLAGSDPKLVHQPTGRASQHHAGEVVALEHQWLLDRAVGKHDLGGAEPVHGVALIDGHQISLVHPAGKRRLKDEHAQVTSSLDEFLRLLGGVVARIGEVSAQRETLVHQRHIATVGGRGDRGFEAGRPAADHEHVDVPMHLLEPASAAVVGVELTQAGGRAQELLVVLPGPPRSDEGLVVEADLHPEPGRDLGQRVQGVALERRPRVDVLHLHAAGDRRHTCSHRRHAIHLHQAVGALTAAAQQAARSVVLERAREDAHAGGVERRGDGVARVSGVGLPLPGECDLARAVDQLATVLQTVAG